ncbi:hypothetical protein [Henriciella litoralis]|uniref:hypothetical protein n=1 Tax=Henriciella litoralis TaxID=568102 RepID=UPI000A02AB24|nr:hypothetical protein [Henriciella litoralis]
MANQTGDVWAKRVERPLLILGALLVCAPLAVYAMDSIYGLGRADPLAVSTLLGGLGAGLMALSQGTCWRRFFIALVGGLALVALQVYGIAFIVLRAPIPG